MRAIGYSNENKMAMVIKMRANREERESEDNKSVAKVKQRDCKMIPKISRKHQKKSKIKVDN